MQSLDFDPQTFKIIGAAMEVHRQLHRGLLETIYCEARAIEFGLRDRRGQGGVRVNARR